jgi:hypothetical protein
MFSTWDSDLEGLSFEQLLLLFPDPRSMAPHNINAAGACAPSATKAQAMPRVGMSQSSPSLLSPSPMSKRTSNGISTSASGDTVEFVSRGCRGELPNTDLPKLYEILLHMNKDNLNTTLDKCYDLIAKPISRSKLIGVVKSFNDETSFIKTSKSMLDFGFPEGKECPLDTAFADEVLLTNIGTGKSKFKVLPIPPATTHILTVNPKDGVIKKKGTMSLNFNLKLRTTTKLSTVLTIEVEGIVRRFYLVN